MHVTLSVIWSTSKLVPWGLSSLSVCHPFCPQLKDLPASYLDVCLAVWQTSYLPVTLTSVWLSGKPLICLLPWRLSPCTANLLAASYLDVCLPVWQTSYLPVILTLVSLYGKPLTCLLSCRLSACLANLLPVFYIDGCLPVWQTSYLPVPLTSVCLSGKPLTCLPVTLTSVWQTSYLPVLICVSSVCTWHPAILLCHFVCIVTVWDLYQLCSLVYFKFYHTSHHLQIQFRTIFFIFIGLGDMIMWI